MKLELAKMFLGFSLVLSPPADRATMQNYIPDQCEPSHGEGISSQISVELHFESTISEQQREEYTNLANKFTQAISNLPDTIRAKLDYKPFRLVVFEDNEYVLNFEDSPTANKLFDRIQDLPNSGVDDTTWINQDSSRWQDYTDQQKEIYLLGELFRNAQARLGVDINSAQSDNYALDIPDWLFYGGPIAWASAVLEDDTSVDDSYASLKSLNLNVSDVTIPGSLIGLPHEAYLSTLYIADTLITEFAGCDYNTLLSYYDLLAEGKTSADAFQESFGVTQEEFSLFMSSQ